MVLVASAGAAPVEVAVGRVQTPVGELWVAVSAVGVVGVAWGGPDRLTLGLRVVADRSTVDPAIEQLSGYFAGQLTAFELPLDLRGLTGSRRLVLQALYDTVPYGSSITYGELAHRSGTGIPARGIGAIMGSNPLPIVIPCHRVLAQNGLGGYSGGPAGEGLGTKRWLLTLEGVLPPSLDWVQPGTVASGGYRQG